MSMNSKKRRRSTAFLDFLLSYGKLAAVPALIVGLLTLGEILGDDGFTEQRLAVIIVCSAIILALVLVEKNEESIRQRFKTAQDNAADVKAGNNPPKPAEPAEPVPEKSEPVEAIGKDEKWQIDWDSGVLDDIGLVYEKAEKDESIVRVLSQLESQALAEARQYCGLVSTSKEKPAAERFDGFSAAEREIAIALLGKKGIQAKRTDVANKEIVVTLSPVIQSIMGCAVFILLNWLEKLDGALNEMVDGKVTLTFQVPLGGRKGLVVWEMLIMRLYPWICIRENATNAITEAPCDEKAGAGAAKAPEQPLRPVSSSKTTVKVQPNPSSPVPASSGSDLTLDEAARVLRDKIIAEIKKTPSKKYELSNLLWDDAASCFSADGGRRWDGAWFYLELDTGKLNVVVSTYPNQFGASYDDTFAISASEFHRIAKQYDFSRELQRFETGEDWSRLFDDSLKKAVADAFAEVQRQDEEKKEALREKHAVRISSGTAAGLPKMNIKRMVLELNQMYGRSSMTLTRERGTYLLSYALTYTSATQNQSYRREASAAEAAWIEERVERAIKDPDDSTWRSIPGGDTMNIEIQREKRFDIALRGVEPRRKYSNLLNEIENLMRFGSIVASQSKAN